MYDREINSISRLTAAVEAVEELNEDEGTDDAVIIDLYVKDGEITFICVQDVAESTEEEEIEADYDFDELEANVDGYSDGRYTEITFSAASNDMMAEQGWKLGDPEIEYTVYVDGEEYDTFTQSISNDVDIDNLYSEMKIEGLNISSGRHTITVEVLVTFSGTSAGDNSTYTLSGSDTTNIF